MRRAPSDKPMPALTSLAAAPDWPPEATFILAILQRLIAGTPLPALPPVDEQRWLALAHAHHLEAILEQYLPPGSLSPIARQHLQSATRQLRLRAAIMTQAFQILQSAMQARGIPIIPLKGLAHAYTLYPSPSLRYFDDIDVLVPAEAAPEAVVALQRAGYAPHPRALRPDWHHLIPYTHPQHGTTIEIHTALVRRHPGGWPLADIWARAQHKMLAGRPTWLLDETDALIFTALHARHHLFSKLNFVLEAVYLAQRVGDTAALLQQVDAAGARTALAHLLRLAQEWGLGSDLPMLRAPAISGYIARRAAAWRGFTPPPEALRHGALPKVLEITLQDSWSEAWGVGQELVWPSAEFIDAGYAATPWRTLNALNRLRQRLCLATRQAWALRRLLAGSQSPPDH